MGLYDSLASMAGSAGNSVSGMASNAGDAMSGMGKGIYDYYMMPDKETFESDYIKKAGSLYEDFGQDLSKEDLDRLKEESSALYKEDEKSKNLRRQVTGALIGGLYGGLSYDKNAASPTTSYAKVTAPRGAGKLGTGYNPFNKRK